MIRIQSGLPEQLLVHAQRNVNEECCGLLAGSGGEITHAFPATNAAADTASAYEIAPEELFHLMREIRAAGLELLGIYHSHPTGENKPSQRDIGRAYYPAAAYFIISPRAGATNPICAFAITNGQASELEIQIV
ncbi:MAG: M67 family metallopeptidase [Candidatus Acidiferrales bacterium]